MKYPRPSTLAASAAGQRPVHLITTHRGRHLFGIHRPDDHGLYTSYVLGFHNGGHAQALARGLEAYRRTHGRFPPRDLSIADMELHTQHSGDEDMRHVAIDTVPLTDIITRLRGTGIVLSVFIPTGSSDSFRWADVQCRAELDAVMAKLDAAFDAEHMELLPKPHWPPQQPRPQQQQQPRGRSKRRDPPFHERFLIELARFLMHVTFKTMAAFELVLSLVL